MIPLVACLFAAALSMVAAGAAIFAAVWARSGAHKVDDFAAIVLPLLVRLKQKVDPDPMVATVVAAAAAAPPPAIIEAPLPVLVAEEAEDEEERRESAPVHAGPPLTLDAVSSDDASEDPGRPTIKMTARPGDEEPYTEAEKVRLRDQAEAEAEARSQQRRTAVLAEEARAKEEAAVEAAIVRWRDGEPSQVDSGPGDPPSTGPSGSGERSRVRRDTIAMPAPVDPRRSVVPRLPPPPVDVAAVRRRAEEQAARFGAEDAEDAVREARDQRQRAEAARVNEIAAEALRPSVEPEDESTKVYSGKVDLGQILAVEPSLRTLSGGAIIPPSAIRETTEDERITARFLVVLEGASPAAVTHCKGAECIVDNASTCVCSCAPCSRRRWLRTQALREVVGTPSGPVGLPLAPTALARVGTIRPPASVPAGGEPRRAHKTLMSEGVVQGPRQRFDPRVEPESPVEIVSSHRQGQTAGTGAER